MIKLSENEYHTEQKTKTSEYAMIVGFADGSYKVIAQLAETFMDARQIVEFKFKNFHDDAWSFLNKDYNTSSSLTGSHNPQHQVVFIKSLACNAYLADDLEQWRNRDNSDDDTTLNDLIMDTPNPRDITKDYFTFEDQENGSLRKNISVCAVTGKVMNDYVLNEHKPETENFSHAFDYGTGGQDRIHIQFGMMYPDLSKEGYEFMTEHLKTSDNPDSALQQLFENEQEKRSLYR